MFGMPSMLVVPAKALAVLGVVGGSAYAAHSICNRTPDTQATSCPAKPPCVLRRNKGSPGRQI